MWRGTYVGVCQRMCVVCERPQYLFEASKQTHTHTHTHTRTHTHTHTAHPLEAGQRDGGDLDGEARHAARVGRARLGVLLERRDVEPAAARTRTNVWRSRVSVSRFDCALCARRAGRGRRGPGRTGRVRACTQPASRLPVFPPLQKQELPTPRPPPKVQLARRHPQARERVHHGLRRPLRHRVPHLNGQLAAWCVRVCERVCVCVCVCVCVLCPCVCRDVED